MGLSAEELAYHEALSHKINAYLTKEKPYLNPEFDMADLAKAVGAVQKEVSFACKHLLHKKFTDLRTQLRIEHAKRLLSNGVSGNTTIDAIGTISGFKSRSTFYEAFKTETGMTPSQYLENLA